jgi:hypothetical protein
MGLGKLFKFDLHGTDFKKNLRRTADGARWVLEWLWNNPQLAGNILSVASQTIHVRAQLCLRDSLLQEKQSKWERS